MKMTSRGALLAGAFTLLTTTASGAASAAEQATPIPDCPLQHAPFSVSLNAYDIMTNPDARAITEKYYPELFQVLPAWLLSESIPSFGTIIELKRLIGRTEDGIDEAKLAKLDAELSALPVTESVQAARCARYDGEPVTFETGDEPVQVLIYHKINGYDHGDSVTAATVNVTKLAESLGYGVSVSDKGSAFTAENLKKFNVVVWNNVSGDTLTLSQQQAFKDYMVNGGGFFGLHASAGDFFYLWDWYRDSLVGAQFIGHPNDPQFQDADIHVHSHPDKLAAANGDGWSMKDEWYSFDRNPADTGANVLLTLDEESYAPGDLAMGYHPLAWTNCVGEGRAIYSAIGHRKEVYEVKQNIRLIKDALNWAAGESTSYCAAK